jgi:hypothetical protein
VTTNQKKETREQQQQKEQTTNKLTTTLTIPPLTRITTLTTTTTTTTTRKQQLQYPLPTTLWFFVIRTSQATTTTQITSTTITLFLTGITTTPIYKLTLKSLCIFFALAFAIWSINHKVVICPTALLRELDVTACTVRNCKYEIVFVVSDRLGCLLTCCSHG